MRKNFYAAYILAIILFITVSCGKGSDVSVFYTGGLNGRIFCAEKEMLPTGNKAGDYVSMAVLLKKILPADGKFLLVDGGNTLVGEDWGLKYLAGRPMLDLMADLPYSAILPGEKEMSLGWDSLDKLTGSTPLLSAFCKGEDGSQCNFLTPFVVKKVGNIKIGVAGVFLPPASLKMPGTPHRYRGLKFEPDWEGLNKKIRDMKANYVILLLRADSLDVLKNLKGVNLVIPYRYHDSQPLDKITEIDGVSVAPVVDSRFKVGEIVLARKGLFGISPSVRIHKIEVGNVAVPEKVTRIMDESIIKGKPSSLEVENSFLAFGLREMSMDLGSQKIAENPTTSYVTDLMREATGAQIAIMNSLSMRQDLAGVIRIDELSTILPYWNELVTMNLTGAQVAELLKENVYEGSNYLSVSGVFLGYQPQSENSMKIYYEGNPIDLSKTYRVVTNDYLAKGGRGKRLTFTQGTDVKYTGLISNYLLQDKLRSRRLLTPPPYRTWNSSVSPFDTARRLLPAALQEFKQNGKKEKALEDLALPISMGLKNEEMLSGFKKSVDQKTYNVVLGRAYYLQGNYPAALDQYLVAAKMAPKDYISFLYMGQLYQEAGYRLEAKEAFEEAVKLNPGSGAGWFGLGLAELNLRSLNESVRAFERSVKIRPDDLPSRMLLGLAKYETGDIEAAGDIWQSAKKLDPGDRNILKLLALFETPEKAAGSSHRLADTAWPKFRGGNRNTGRSRFRGPEKGTLKWRFATYHNVMASPAIGKNGIIYVGSGDRFFYAIRPDGTLAWNYRAGDSLLASPAISQDGTIYVGCNDKSLYALDPKGQARWIYVTGGAVKSSPAIEDDGTVVFGSEDGALYAVSHLGAFKWKYQTQQEIFSSPAISPDGTVYIGGKDGSLYAVKPDGNLRWAYKTENRILSSPAVGDDGTVYIGSDDQHLYAIAKDGKLKWRFKTGKLPSSPGIAHDGTIYIGSDDFCLYAITKEGNLRWKFKAGADVFSSVAIDPDGNIYFGGEDNTIYSLFPTGKLRWKLQTLDYLESSPAISSDGVLIVGCEDKHIYAVGP
ncbi:MAG: PQQ-binding-like beta-propeller repeat protein [Chloroflexi bacterium]|nr:PQQ-binding-like beta-propeller repeat protein [Chloroflexota bacterium]